MAAFPSSSSSSSYQQQHPFLDSSSSSIINSTINFDQPNNALFYQHMIMNVSHNEHSVFSATNKNSMDSSSVVTDHHNNHLYKKSDHLLHELPPNPISMDRNKRKAKHSSSPNSAQSKDMRGKKHKKVKDCEEKKEAPTGYIHVRARRGQATDSHSLAERVRRERISERMNLLQALVPGCDKVTGKALMLDEIINYVQSLQHQVEFLSMKLASVNPMLYDFGMDLESLMVRSDQSLSSLPSPFPECSPTTTNTHPVWDNSSILLQSHIPYAHPQGDKEVLWGGGVDAQTHKVINQSGINTTTLFSFPLM